MDFVVDTVLFLLTFPYLLFVGLLFYCCIQVVISYFRNRKLGGKRELSVVLTVNDIKTIQSALIRLGNDLPGFVAFECFHINEKLDKTLIDNDVLTVKVQK